MILLPVSLSYSHASLLTIGYQVGLYAQVVWGATQCSSSLLPWIPQFAAPFLSSSETPHLYPLLLDVLKIFYEILNYEQRPHNTSSMLVDLLKPWEASLSNTLELPPKQIWMVKFPPVLYLQWNLIFWKQSMKMMSTELHVYTNTRSTLNPPISALITKASVLGTLNMKQILISEFHDHILEDGLHFTSLFPLFDRIEPGSPGSIWVTLCLSSHNHVNSKHPLLSSLELLVSTIFDWRCLKMEMVKKLYALSHNIFHRRRQYFDLDELLRVNTGLQKLLDRTEPLLWLDQNLQNKHQVWFPA